MTQGGGDRHTFPNTCKSNSLTWNALGAVAFGAAEALGAGSDAPCRGRLRGGEADLGAAGAQAAQNLRGGDARGTPATSPPRLPATLAGDQSPSGTTMPSGSSNSPSQPSHTIAVTISCGSLSAAAVVADLAGSLVRSARPRLAAGAAAAASSGSHCRWPSASICGQGDWVRGGGAERASLPPRLAEGFVLGVAVVVQDEMLLLHLSEVLDASRVPGLLLMPEDSHAPTEHLSAVPLGARESRLGLWCDARDAAARAPRCGRGRRRQVDT